MATLSTLLQELLNINEKQGFITEELLFNKVNESNLTLVEIDNICEEILSRGVLITDSLTPRKNKKTFKVDRSRIDWVDLYEKIASLSPNSKNLIGMIRDINPPQKNEFSNLIKHAQNGNFPARTRIIEMYLRDALRIGYNYSRKYNSNLEESIQDAFVGLVEAVDSFDDTKYSSFIGHVNLCIFNLLRRVTPINDTHFYFPVHVKDLVFKFLKEANLEKGRLDYRDVVTKYEKMKNKIKRLEFEKLKHILDLVYFSINFTDAEEQGILLLDETSENELFEKINNFELSVLVERIFEEFSEKTKKILMYRNGFINDKIYTLKEIGEFYQVSRERIRQIETKAMKKIKLDKYSKLLKEFL